MDVRFKIITRRKKKGLAYHLYLPLDKKPHGQQRARTTPLLGYDLTQEQAYSLAVAKIREIREAPKSGPFESRRGSQGRGARTLRDGIALYWQMMTLQNRVDFARPQSIIANHLLPFFGTHPLTSYTPQLGIAYISKRREHGAAVNTIRREWNVLDRIINLCVEADWLAKNPLKMVTKNLPSRQRRSRIVTDQELHLLSKQCHPDLWRLVVAALHTGLREAKLLSIESTWLQVQEDGGWLILPKARSSIKGNPLRLPLNALAERALFPLHGASSQGRVFARWKNASSIKHLWSRTCQRAGIEDLHFHDLRHTFATRLQNAGVDYEVRQHLLGHAIKGETGNYSHGGEGWNNKLRAAVQRLDGEMINAKIEL
ncbi:MAG: hypothetical protein NPIRA02_10680 [Nitrospirales bacterium]|nr:MAG: hypothetical protein NPIRA02_10680 [Nitrospirales bacterium]